MNTSPRTTRIFLDGGDPEETKEVFAALGWLDGQTTNPTLIAKNPDAQKRIAAGTLFSPAEIFDFYRGVIEKISTLIPHGSVSIEVYADKKTTTEEMVTQGKKMYEWIPNAHIKLPITKSGLAAAHELVAEGIRVNMTLCFSLAQAAAVYSATKGAAKGQVFLSPFVGRLDDVGQNGFSLIENLIQLFKHSDHHVEILVASVRTQSHFNRALELGVDIITAPKTLLLEWAHNNQALPSSDFAYTPNTLTPIPYEFFDLEQPFDSFDIAHPLTEKGLERFAADWNALLTH